MHLSSIVNGGTSAFFQFWPSRMHIYGSIGHFHLIEAPTMRLPNVKMLLRWPSRMHIYGFIESCTFLEQFVSMGVPAQFIFYGSVDPL